MVERRSPKPHIRVRFLALLPGKFKSKFSRTRADTIYFCGSYSMPMPALVRGVLIAEVQGD